VWAWHQTITKGVNFQPSKRGQFSAAVDTPAISGVFVTAAAPGPRLRPAPIGFRAA
jgi:hypothetical protein